MSPGPDPRPAARATSSDLCCWPDRPQALTAGRVPAQTRDSDERTVIDMAGLPAEVAAASVPDDAWLLDVREDDEWAAGHAPRARHIPLGQLGARAAEIPQGRDIYVICRSGGRSGRAAQALAGAGWRAINVAGGMQDWAVAGRPMVTDSGAEPFVA